MRRALLVPAGLLAACGADPASLDSGAGGTVDGGSADAGSDGADGGDGADGADDAHDYEALRGAQTYDVYGPDSDRPDLCQLTWLLQGRPADATCADCVWSFAVSGSFDADLSATGACGAPSDLYVVYASDGETLFYEYGGGFVALGPVTTWDPTAEAPNFGAQWSTEISGYTYVTTVSAEVR